MARLSVNLTPFAQEDVREFWKFVAAKSQSHSVADRVFDDIFAGFEYLCEFPEAGHFREELANKPIRFHQVHSYIIAYYQSGPNLVVIGAIHASRDVSEVLGERW